MSPYLENKYGTKTKLVANTRAKLPTMHFTFLSCSGWGHYKAFFFFLQMDVVVFFVYCAFMYLLFLLIMAEA